MRSLHNILEDLKTDIKNETNPDDIKVHCDAQSPQLLVKYSNIDFQIILEDPASFDLRYTVIAIPTSSTNGINTLQKESNLNEEEIISFISNTV